jgi:hypothetical protein
LLAVILHRFDDDVVESRIAATETSGDIEHAPGDASAEHLVKHDSGGIEVGAGVHLRTHEQCLRCHEVRRAHRHVGLGQRTAAAGFAAFCQAEIGYFDVTFGTDQNIGRLDVAVDDAVRVGIVQRIAMASPQRGKSGRGDAEKTTHDLMLKAKQQDCTPGEISDHRR